MTKYLVMVGAFVILGLGLWGVIARHDSNLLEEFKRESAVKQNDSTETVLKPVSDSLRTVYINQKVPYVVYRDRVIHDHPTDTTIVQAFGKCDQLILTCEQRQRIDSARITNLQSEVKTLKALKKEKPNRVSAFITGGMDFIASQPLVQAGGEVRMFGPLGVTAFIEAARRNNQNDIDTRGVVALKFSFR